MKPLFPILPVLLLVLTACSPTTPPNAPLEHPARRIISLAPSVTESLCAVGGLSNLVGVTTFCCYPPEITDLPRIGGYTDTNYERILALRPDLVVTLDEHEKARKRLDELGIRHITIDTSTIPAILQSLETLGQITGHTNTATTTIQSLQQTMDTLQEKAQAHPSKRVLISIGRNMGTGGLSDVYLAGPGTLYNELLQLAHAENAYTGRIAYAKVSRESLQRMNPDVIIDLIPDLDSSKNITPEQVRNDWRTLSGVTAVQTDQLYVFGGNYVCIPGPRFIQVLQNLITAIHPELEP